MLSTESKAAVVDGVISAGAGGGLLAATLLGETPLGFLVPVADSIIVLVMCGFIIADPVRMFLRSLREVAGGAAQREVVQKVRARTEELLTGQPLAVVEVAVTKLGRSYFVVPYLEPEQDLSAAAIDALRHELDAAYAELLGAARTEIIITAEHPYEGDNQNFSLEAK